MKNQHQINIYKSREYNRALQFSLFFTAVTFIVYDVCFQIMIVYKWSWVIINVWNATQVER